MSKHNQFNLLTQRRFAPFFWTQFGGAFNDNLFKNALIISLAFNQTRLSIDLDILINLCAALFILPFLLFSSTAGQLADKFDKALLIRYIKLAEIFLAGVAFLGFHLEHTPLLISVLFLLGTQSAFFGPIKYSILPDHLKETELVGGNGLVEMGTFVAILVGTLTGGILVSMHQYAGWWISGTLFIVALLGWIFSLKIPKTPSSNPTLKIDWNIFTTTWRILQFSQKKPALYLSIIGISWFWAYGAIFLTQLPNYVQDHLYGNEQVATLFLATFSIGIGFGSLLCEHLSGRRIELGLVPFGSIGLTIFTIDLSFAHLSIEPSALQNAWDFLQHFSSWRITLDLLFIGFFGGFYVVPLYTILQYRSKAGFRSQIIAANNILNTIFMVSAAIFAIAIFKLGLNIPQLFLIIGILNALIAVYIYCLLPEFLLGFINWVIISIFYRIDRQELQHIPRTGACILICNHVSYLDPCIIAAACRRPIRFVMDNSYYQLPFLKFFFKSAKAIPISTARENPKMVEQAMNEITKSLQAGHIVGIFPEGRLTRTGELNRFQPGILQIIKRTPVPIIPMALRGLWGSFFSWRHGKVMRHFPRNWPFFQHIDVMADQAVSPEQATLKTLEDTILSLRGDKK